MEELSKTAKKILLAAYSQYSAAPNKPFTYPIENEENVPIVANAIHELHRKNCICNVSTYTTRDAIAIPISAESITFTLTMDGVAAAKAYWKS